MHMEMSIELSPPEYLGGIFIFLKVGQKRTILDSQELVLESLFSVTSAASHNRPILKVLHNDRRPFLHLLNMEQCLSK